MKIIGRLILCSLLANASAGLHSSLWAQVLRGSTPPPAATTTSAPSTASSSGEPKINVPPNVSVKPTQAQSRAALSKLASSSGKMSPMIAGNAQAAQLDAATIAVLQQQKQAPLQPGQTMGATGDPAGGSTPPGTPGSTGTSGGSGAPGMAGPTPTGTGSTPTGGTTRTATSVTARTASTAVTPAPSSGSPLGSATVKNSQFDACSVAGLAAYIKGINGQVINAVPTFSQDPAYNPFTVIGCHFGSATGRAYLNNAAGQKIADMKVVSWTDTIIRVSVDPNLLDALDSDNVTLVVAPANGQPGQKTGCKFWAMRKELMLPSIPFSQVSVARITDSGGQGVGPWYTSPYQGLAYSFSVQSQVSKAVAIAEGKNGDAGMTAGVDRNDWYRFGGGTDTFDFSKLKAGFYVSRFQIDERTAPACFYSVTVSPGVGDETDYDDGSWNAQYNINENKIHVTFAERHCHLTNGTDSSNSTYAINVWIKGPALSANNSPWQAGVH